MTDWKLERNRRMKVAYQYARMGNVNMAMEFASAANSYWNVTKQQWQYLDLLVKANKVQEQGLVITNNKIERLGK